MPEARGSQPHPLQTCHTAHHPHGPCSFDMRTLAVWQPRGGSCGKPLAPLGLLQKGCNAWEGAALLLARSGSIFEDLTTTARQRLDAGDLEPWKCNHPAATCRY